MSRCPNHGLAHEARHAMERIRDGHLESDVIPLATSVSTMELLDEIRAQSASSTPKNADATTVHGSRSVVGRIVGVRRLEHALVQQHRGGMDRRSRRR